MKGVKRRYFLTLFISLLIFGLVACSNSNVETQSDGKSNEKSEEITIGFAMINTAINPYATIYDEIIKAEAKKLGVKLVVLDAQSDPVAQSQHMQSLIQQKVDSIILWPVNAEAIIPDIKKAQDAGIPVIVTNSPISADGMQYITAYSGPDNKLQGRLAAEMMVEALDGKEGKIVEITGLPGYQTTIDRMEGFREVLKDHPEIEIIDSQPGNFDRAKSQEVMENFLTKYKEIDGIYAAEDNMAAGAITALKEAGRLDKVKITSATFYGVGYDAIQKDELYGSVVQEPELDAKIAIETALKAAKGEKVEKSNYFDTPKVTKENLSEFEKPEF